MKIAIRGGHNFTVPGASALIDETTEDRKVKNSVIKYLKMAGHEVIDVTAPDSYNTVLLDLEYGVNLAEREQVDLFMSCHFDKCYDHYDGAMGTACWILGTGGQAEKIGARVCKSVSNGTGLVNRGIHIDPKLYELRKTTIPAIICETCFTEATKDIEIYHKVGADIIGKLIADGINGSDIIVSETPADDSNNINQTSQTDDSKLKQDVNKPADIENTDSYGIVTASVLNVRDKASINSNIIGTLDKGTKVKLSTKIGDWWNIYYGEHGGFVSDKYVNKLKYDYLI